MSYTEYEQFLKDFGVPRAGVEGGEVVLKKIHVLKALELLDNTEIAVLGGDVYILEDDGYFQSTYDNWYCNKGSDGQALFSKRSHKLAYEYISSYQEKSGLNIWYVLVIDKKINK